MPTPHIEAKVGEIAETILLPGDPLRAKAIADHYLSEVTQFNDVRNMLGYTGYYNGKRISVMGTGMGMPSMAIYSYELIQVYGVKNLIRIGTAGAIQPHVRIRDIVIAQAASTDSNYAKQFGLEGVIAAVSYFQLLQKSVQEAAVLGLKYHVGNMLSSDIFYHYDKENWKKWQKIGVLCIEMEAYALLLNAAYLGASALTIATISDSLITGEKLSHEERQNSFLDVMKIALAIAP